MTITSVILAKVNKACSEYDQSILELDRKLKDRGFTRNEYIRAVSMQVTELRAKMLKIYQSI